VGEPNGAASAIDGRLSRFGCRLRGRFSRECSDIEFGDSDNGSRQGRVIGSMMNCTGLRPRVFNLRLIRHAGHYSFGSFNGFAPISMRARGFISKAKTINCCPLHEQLLRVSPSQAVEFELSIT
jgi:hypothetical protein